MGTDLGTANINDLVFIAKEQVITRLFAMKMTQLAKIGERVPPKGRVFPRVGVYLRRVRTQILLSMLWNILIKSC